MQTIYLVQQGKLYYDDDFYYIRDTEFSNIAGIFVNIEQAKELQKKLIDFSYNLLKDKLHCIDFSDCFDTHKRPSEVEDYEKLNALLNILLRDHIQIKEYELDDSCIIHPDNKSPLKKYAAWNTIDADTSNKSNSYLDMDYDNPKYESILESVMNIAEDRFDAGIGLSWDHIEWAWQEYLETYKPQK